MKPVISIISKPFGHYALIRIGEGKTATRTSAGPYPTRELAKEVVDSANLNIHPETVILKAKKALEKAPFLMEQFPLKVVQFKGKHNDATYIARTEKDFELICMDQFKENDSMNYYSHFDTNPVPIKPSFEIENIPEELKKQAEETLKKYTREMSSYAEGTRLVSLRDKAREGNYQAAKQLIEEMRSSEYEGYEIIEPIQLENTNV